MNGIHDLGGMDNLGPIPREQDEPVFHEDWERTVFAHTLAMLGAGYCKTDEIRSYTEWMAPAAYLQAKYYQKWLFALEEMLVDKGVLTEEELARGRSFRDDGTKRPPLAPDIARYVLSQRIPASLDLDVPPRFKPGDRIVTRNLNPLHHTRLSRYVRRKLGVVEQDHGVFALPDAVASGAPERPQHVYTVRFTARELWGEDADPHGALYIDLFDDYMDPASERAA
jgi:nitrile hydratase